MLNAIKQFFARVDWRLALMLGPRHSFTAEQWQRLSGLGCELFQGYWFSAPLEIADFEAYADAGRLPPDWVPSGRQAQQPLSLAQASAG